MTYTQCEYILNIQCEHDDDCNECYFRKQIESEEKIGIDGVMKEKE